MNVLIVEDNRISSKVLEHTLGKHGYETYTTTNGEEALEYLHCHPEVQLVITDIVMPKSDGFELIRKIKDHPELNQIPILICTSQRPALVSTRLPMEGWKYLFKPIRADNLMHLVEEAISIPRPVLQNPDQTMAQLGMDTDAFVNVIGEFHKIVSHSIALLEERISKQLCDPLDLQNLMEGAKLLRADRIVDIHARISKIDFAANRELGNSMYLLLLRELKSMEHYLTLYQRPKNPYAGNNDASSLR